MCDEAWASFGPGYYWAEKLLVLASHAFGPAKVRSGSNFQMRGLGRVRGYKALRSNRQRLLGPQVAVAGRHTTRIRGRQGNVR